MKSITLAVLLVAAAGLSGCTDDAAQPNTIFLSEQSVPIDGSATRDISCGVEASLHVQGEGDATGDFSVTVESGGSVPIFGASYAPGSGMDVTEELAGNPGIWNLTVHRSLEFDGTFTVALTC